MDKQHAVINYDQDRDEHWVKDLGSLNGVSAPHLSPCPSLCVASPGRVSVGPTLSKTTHLSCGPPGPSRTCTQVGK